MVLMPHECPGAHEPGSSLQPNLHPDSLAWDKLPCHYRSDSPLAKVDRPSGQRIRNSRPQHGHIQRNLRLIPRNAPPRRFVPAQRLCPHRHKLISSPYIRIDFEEPTFQRRNSTISLPSATSTVLAIPINSPCSTTPGMSLSRRARASGSG